MERVLVCLICSTRGHEVTFPSFKRQVLDELNADLALAIAVGNGYDYRNPYWQHARYRWTIPDSNDYGTAFDAAQRTLCERDNIPAPEWRSILRIRGIWLGGIHSAEPQPTACALALFCRWLLLQRLREEAVLDRYDRFVITRSDFVWLCPHPPLSVLEPGRIWIPDGEDYDGLADRHLVVSRDDLENCLNLIEPILLTPAGLYEEMKHNDDWNSEQYLLHHFRRTGLVERVMRFPYVMYLARHRRDYSATWSQGSYDASLGHFVKYDTEFHSAAAFATIIRSRADWEARAWMQCDPTAVAPRPVSTLSRLVNALDTVVWALKRPQRLSRLGRFLRRTLG